jgi:hypothetical protein
MTPETNVYDNKDTYDKVKEMLFFKAFPSAEIEGEWCFVA